MPQEFFESEIYGEADSHGLKLDFNFGLRLDVPEGNFRVKVSDFDTEQIYFDENFSGGRLLSVENYFIRWHVEVFLDEEKIFTHTFNPQGQPVAVKLVSPKLGDTFAFMPYVREFKKIYDCDLSLLPIEYLRELIAQLYPDIPLIDKPDFSKTYATYYPIMLMSSFPLTPGDFRKVSMTRVSGIIFGIDLYSAERNFQADGAARYRRALRLHCRAGFRDD